MVDNLVLIILRAEGLACGSSVTVSLMVIDDLNAFWDEFRANKRLIIDKYKTYLFLF